MLAIAASAFANEVEDRTLANLTLTPLPRWQIVVPKLLAVMTVAAPFVVSAASSPLTWLFWATCAPRSRSPSPPSPGWPSSLGLPLAWAGTTQAIGLGLLYIVLWEGFFSGFVSGVRLLIRHYAIGLMHGLDARRFAGTDHLLARAGHPDRVRGRLGGFPLALGPAASADGRALATPGTRRPQLDAGVGS